MEPFNSKMANLGTQLVASLGALNVGLVEMFEYDLVVDLLGLGTDMQTIAFAAVGLAGAALLVSMATGGRVDQVLDQ